MYHAAWACMVLRWRASIARFAHCSIYRRCSWNFLGFYEQNSQPDKAVKQRRATFLHLPACWSRRLITFFSIHKTAPQIRFSLALVQFYRRCINAWQIYTRISRIALSYIKMSVFGHSNACCSPKRSDRPIDLCGSKWKKVWAAVFLTLSTVCFELNNICRSSLSVVW